jgi:hypothetical protein
MSSRYGPSSRKIWSLAGSNLGSGIGGAGNSGSWPTGQQLTPSLLNAMTPVDLRDVNDLALMVSIAAIVSAPSITVNLDVYDDVGALYPAVATSGAITTATTKLVSVGAHGAGAFVIFPNWGRVSWTCTGGSATGVEIELWAR